ncbi:competence protein CoiA [Paucilactobacillus kaifaensis]|uniref:competence protein CoiA n=1 Tax=Paucilactobacillus kaifaensis TaxID=2559921 RepID=UPI0010F68F67|nr:competence protein CoiA family protein [Paucilactobacillus kaifaensis]
MLVAMENRKLVVANASTQKGCFTCPACNQKVYLRRGTIKIAHFAHTKGADCVASEGETREHLLGKKQLYNWAKQHHFEPVYEVYLPKIKQRPDLLIKINGQSVALEYQCSPISLQRLQERNVGYHKLKMPVWWILGSPYQDRHLTASKVAQFTQLIFNKFDLLFWSTGKRKFMNGENYLYVDFCQPKHAAPRQVVVQQTKRIEQQIMAGNQRLLPIVQQCYQAGHLFVGIPIVGHHIDKQWPCTLYGLTIWQTQVLLALEKVKFYHQWSLENWFAWLNQIAPEQWLTFPCLLPIDQVKLKYLKEFTIQLQKHQIITVNTCVCYINSPKWFNDSLSKINYINQH